MKQYGIGSLTCLQTKEKAVTKAGQVFLCPALRFKMIIS